MEKIIQDKIRTYEAVIKSTLHRLKISHLFSVEKKKTIASDYPIYIIVPTDLDRERLNDL